MGGAMGAEPRQLLVMKLVHIEGADRIVFRQSREVDDPSRFCRHDQGGLLGGLRRCRHADPLGPLPLGSLEHVRHPVVLTGDPCVVDEGAYRVERSLESLLVDIRKEDFARPPVARHDRLPATDRSGTEDDDGVAEAHVEDLDAIERAGERVGDGRQVRRQVRGQRDDVLHGNRRHLRVLGVGAGKGIVAIEEVLVAEILKAFRAPAALPAGEDGAEKDSIAFLHTEWKVGPRPQLLDDADRFVTEDPRCRRLWIAVEEGPGVGAADAACLDLEDGALRVDIGLRRLADLHRVDAGHKGGPHRAAPTATSSSIAAKALRAGHRSLITRESARVMASGERCMKMFRPTEQPMAPACMAHSIRRNNSASSTREPPARTTGIPLMASTRRPNASPSPGQLVLTMSAPSSAQRRTLRRRYSKPYRSANSSTEA